MSIYFPIGQKRPALKPGNRVIVRYEDGYEEQRIVAIGPKRIDGHDGPDWWIWLDNNMGRFALRRVRPAEETGAGGRGTGDGKQ